MKQINLINKKLFVGLVILCQTLNVPHINLDAAEQLMPVETQTAPEISPHIASSQTDAQRYDEKASMSQFMMQNENALSQEASEMPFKETVVMGTSTGEVKVTELGPTFPKDGSITMILKKTSDHAKVGNLGQQLSFKLNKILASDGSVLEHAKTISGLTAGETYSYYFEIRDKKGVLTETTKPKETKTQDIKVTVTSIKAELLDAEFIVSLTDENGKPIKEHQRVFVDIEDLIVGSDGKIYPAYTSYAFSRQSDGTYRAQISGLNPNKLYQYEISVKLANSRPIKVAVSSGEFRTKSGPPIEDVRHQVVNSFGNQQLVVEAKIANVPAGASVRVVYEEVDWNNINEEPEKKASVPMTTQSKIFPNLTPLFTFGCFGKPEPATPSSNSQAATYKAAISGAFPPIPGVQDIGYAVGAENAAYALRQVLYRFHIEITLRGRVISRWPVNNAAHEFFMLMRRERIY